MKYLLALLLLPEVVQAAPYFRPLWGDPAHPQVNFGACTDPVNVGHSEQCTVVAIISHSHLDGSIFFKGEDWALLGVGYAASGTGAKMVLGPSWNLAPAAGEALVAAVKALAPGSRIAEDLSILSADAQGGNLNGAFGPAWAYDPIENKGFFRIFVGAKWAF